MKIRTGSLSKGVQAALFSAGPIFLLMWGLATLYALIPHPIPVTIAALDQLYPMMQLVVLSVPGGAIVSLPGILSGSFVLSRLADRVAWFRQKWVWTISGLIMGLAIASLSRNYIPVAFALTVTSVICATLCRHWIDWVDEDIFISPWARQN
ncbi:hypothetical protein ASE00_12255 [Sphingomonas sp. Root710]|uniref:hypothetical protein n=1 Tax=Sphingomonas sp. Root710 TaxID=1736594 RepID=UPI0006F21CA1|nr:hypothetical protein [Sphingomonas sp. Root710]KRB82790.1 hypothetical protein ASE00_12255 [Sphingomonas sp. Root710]